MSMTRWSFVPAAAAVLAAVVGSASNVQAQATTGNIGGRVVGPQGEPLEAAQVQVVNVATGRTSGAQSRSDGRFLVLGLEPSSRYRVTVRRIGYAPQTVEPVVVTLGQTTPVQFRLGQQATQLTAVTVQASAENSLISPTRRGTQTTITDTLIRKLPTLNRNFTDFVALTPQVSTSGPGLSGGGVNNRFNNIQIDGATERDLFGLGSTGQPGGQAGGKSIGIESVKEFQVLLAPFDVRIGNFAGASINAITKSGTNEVSGSLYTYGRNQDLQRSQPYLTEFRQYQYGVTLGGPLVKNRAHFFVNPEFQSQARPAAGFALGDANSRLTAAQLDAFRTQLEQRGLVDLGSGARVTNRNPLANVFARLDVALTDNTSLVVRHNYAHAEQDVFSRGSSGSTPDFRLSRNGYQFLSTKQAPVAQLRTNFANGGFNELIVGFTQIRDKRATPGRLQPQVSMIQPGVATLLAGTENSSQANQLDQDIFEVTENLTIPLGAAHRLTVGTQNQFFQVRNLFGQNVVGNWTFGTPDSLAQGIARQYRVSVPVAGDGAVRFRARQLSAYAQDEWTATDRLSITAGVRLDMPSFGNRPPFNPAVQTELGINTSEFPSGNLQVSPRLGFNWNATGDLRNQLRGGVGMFQGSPAYVWLANSFQNSGGVSGFASLTCTGSFAPRFTAATALNAPTACAAGGPTARAGSDVNFIRDDVKFPQTLRTNLAYDRALGEGLVLTLEGLYTRTLNNLFYANYALADAQATKGLDGRTLYGLQPQRPVRRVSNRDNALGVTNNSKDYAYNLTAKLEKRFRTNFGGAVAYTYSQAFDVQSLTSSTAGSQYRFGRVYSGSQFEQNLTHSAFEAPHRIVANGSYAFRRTGTSISAIYTGQSGLRYAFVSNDDLNGDNVTQNDPVYVPTGPTDPKAPVFQPFTPTGGTALTAQEQSDAFFAFIERTECLRAAKGRILERNTCMTPWVNQLDVSIEQNLPTLRGQRLSLRVDAINFANLLNKNWGRQITTNNFNPQSLYTQRGIVLPGTTTAADLTTGVPLVNYTPGGQEYNYDNVFSNYSLQLSVRYSF